MLISSTQRPIILSASAFEENKHIDRVIEAVSLYGRGSLLLCGDGSKRNEILELATRKLKGKFCYIGPVSKERMAEVYDYCDMLILASQGESFGNVLVEAMAANMPVIADDDEDRKWIIGNGGVTCNVANVYELAKAIKTVAEADFEDRPLVQAKNFKWDGIIKSWENMIIAFGKK